MKSNLPSPSAITEIPGKLFHQLQAFGRFSSKQSPFSKDSTEVFGLLQALFRVLEETIDLRFEAEETPFIYNTQLWNCPRLAGFTSGQNDPLPSEILLSLAGSWKLQEENPQPLRFLKGAIFVQLEDGVERAVEYLLACFMHGLIYHPETLWVSLNYLIKGNLASTDEPSFVRCFFGRNTPPNSQRERIDFQMVPDIPDEAIDEKKAQNILDILFEAVFKELDKIHHSENFDRWYSGRWRCRDLLGVVRQVIDDHYPRIPLSYRPSYEQIEEIRADTGSYHFMASAYSDFGYSLSSIQSSFIVAQMLQEIDNIHGLNRAINERLIVPHSIATQTLQGDLDNLSLRWRYLSVGHAIALSHHLQRGGDFHLTRDRRFTVQEISENPDALKVFLDHGVVDPGQRTAILDGSARNDPNLPTDRILDEIQRKMCMREISDFVARIDPEVTQEIPTRLHYLSEFLKSYPFFHFALYELAIATDQSGSPADALELIGEAILASPLDPMRWQSLSVIAGNSGRDSDAKIAYAITAMIAERSQDTES